MNSPITGKPMSIRIQKSNIIYRGIKVPYSHHFYRCYDSGEEFTDTQLDTINMKIIHDYWLSTRRPAKKENKTEKVLRDTLNKYKSWHQQETAPKLDRPLNYIKINEYQSKIDVIEEIQRKLCQ